MSRRLDIGLLDISGDSSLTPSAFELYNIQLSAVSEDQFESIGFRDGLIINSTSLEQAQKAIDTIAGIGRHQPPILVLSNGDVAPTGAQGWLRRPASAVQISNRLQAMRRLWIMEDVARRRRAACEVFGHQFSDDPAEQKPLSILFVGDATSKFMVLRHTLEQTGAEIVAAFSSFSAFDYLHERPFDAVILNATSKKDLAFTISSAMRRNARLYHTPVLLLTDTNEFAEADEAFARGVSDILSTSAKPVEISERVVRLGNERRRRRTAKAILENCRARSTTDHEYNLFRPRISLAHLQDLLNTAARNRKPTGLVLMRIEKPNPAVSDEHLTAAKKQFASMLRHLLRAEDLPAVLDSDVFAALLPYTDREGAACVAERVSAVAECTAFDSDDPLKPFRLDISCVSLEAAGEETAEALIERGMRLLAADRLEAV